MTLIEEFLKTLTYEKLMGATPRTLLSWFYEWLEYNGYVFYSESE